METCSSLERGGKWLTPTSEHSGTYGAQANKVSKIIGGSESEGIMVFDAFWEAAYPLKGLKDNLERYWKNTGQKKFILGIDRRKVPTRSAHAIVNSLFQSAGVICAKRAMVIHDRKLKEAGLWVDFFRDDYQNMVFAQQMIAYHDEAQVEVSRSLVKMKSFPFEEGNKESEKAAKALADSYKKEMEATGEIWSNVGHTDKVYYVGYTLAGDLAIQAVREAGQYYKLNVELSAGYDLGTNWATCH